MKRFNWQIWAGFLLSVIALFSYPFVFVRWPLTRDFPWANLLLFGITVLLLLVGIRRSFAPDRRRPTRSKIAASVIGTLSIAMLAFFIFTAFIASRWLPAARDAPKVGQKAPDFSLADTTGRMVSVSELLSTPIKSVPPALAGGSELQPGKAERNEREARTAPKGVLLVFYRGYW